jgi:hypothetical protein
MVDVFCFSVKKADGSDHEEHTVYYDDESGITSENPKRSTHDLDPSSDNMRTLPSSQSKKAKPSRHRMSRVSHPMG